MAVVKPLISVSILLLLSTVSAHLSMEPNPTGSGCEVGGTHAPPLRKPLPLIFLVSEVLQNSFCFNNELLCKVQSDIQCYCNILSNSLVSEQELRNMLTKENNTTTLFSFLS